MARDIRRSAHQYAGSGPAAVDAESLRRQNAGGVAKAGCETVTVTKGWSEAYGLFLKGESDLVLSYTTSPAYHIIAEKKDNYAAANFAEGHYLQVEVAARTAASKQPELAEKFLKFMISPAFQNAIPTGNWMYPVTDAALPAGFEQLNKPQTALEFTPQQVAAQRRMDKRMATRRQPLIPGWLVPGLIAAILMVVVSLGAFLALWFNAPESDLLALWHDSYLWHVIRFSFWQAFLSALLSVIPAIFLARALYRRRFPGRLALLRLCAMTLILPVLVAVFGILSVYGRRAGWPPSSTCLVWNGPSPLRPEGHPAGAYFLQYADGDAPLLQALENIPGEQRQIAAQLGMRGWSFSALSNGRGCDARLPRWPR